ncbi:hypothetical protein LV75_001516 [Actinokineospora diospyrosa]|uniref:NACHT N-terminal Helical domain-containing protein n=1 Tax=Actinokineospora diospyrosa TaxID=103728 RepID=A0ABT1I8X7_9PSEU|nr:hypothetical protein [Actinokineospora diospyrosa]MCP2269028.1 hypothetical protein [Actinokineospora diospyrosa]
MRRNPPITFQGALKVLGHHDRPWLDRLDSLLGGVILASVGIAPIEGLWALVDQKNEAVRLVRTGLDAVSDKLLHTNGVERQDLLVAAHTILVMTSYFEVVDEHRKTPDRDKVALATGSVLNEKNWLNLLYTNPLPAPSATKTFATLLADISGWASLMVASAPVDTSGRASPNAIGAQVANRYQAHFLQMARRVPEFGVWAELTERAAVGSILISLSAMLAHGPSAPPRDLRKVLADANSAELDLPLVRAGAATVFPTVREIVQTPRGRIAEHSTDCALSDEGWWDTQGVRVDLGRVFAVHFSSTSTAIERPMLLLGHPGSGKSLLTKVLAASLPATNYTVVRVPLRHVDANAQVDTQIQTALDLLTHRRVSWPDLADQTSGSLRVVLLDGLDELLQATTHDRTGYLHDVETFQRREAALGHPVAVVVTSRTLVVDRVAVPHGVPVVKLEDFDEKQVEAWTAVWNRVNERSGVRLLPPRLAENVATLSRQPLLLMMLAVYYADWAAPEPTAQMSLTDLYERMFALFARREAEKRTTQNLDAAVQSTLRRLSVAALGMLNRGAQWIAETELAADLTALGEPVTSGKRLLAEFYFVHSPQARTDVEHRAYEFLHATFGEYLVADRVVEVLRDVAGARAGHRPDDDLLFALLSHQPLSNQRPVLDFAAAKLAKLALGERENVAKALEELLACYHEHRVSGHLDNYRPTPYHAIRRAASYSANLVLLRTAVPGGDLHLPTIWPHGPKEQWQSLVRLWTAGLDATGISTVCAGLELHLIRVYRNRTPGGLPPDLAAARLMGDPSLELRLRTGNAVFTTMTYYSNHEDWAHYAFSSLVAAAVGVHFRGFPAAPPSGSVDPAQLVPIVELAKHVLRTRCADWDIPVVVSCVLWIADLDPKGELDWLVEVNNAHGPGLRAAILAQEDSSTARRVAEGLTGLPRGKPYRSGLSTPFVP